MDFTRFINSRDIRAHLREINHPFTAPEAAYLVYRSLDATMEERLTAWREILQTMPDCSMEERLNMKAIHSFHGFLREYIDLQVKGLARFPEHTGAIYTYAYYDGERRGVNNDGWHDCGAWFSTFDKCISHCRSDLEEELATGEVTALRIEKQNLDPLPGSWKCDCFLDMNPRFEILSCRFAGLTDEEREIDGAFDGMWFSFPTPFRRGDILKSRCSDLRETPFVLDRLCTWDEAMMLQNGFAPEDPRTKHADRLTGNLLRDGDSSDMTALGYGVNHDGSGGWSLYFDHFSHHYLDLEYFRDPLTGGQRLLKPVSEFLKGSCDIALLQNSWKLITLEEQCRESRKQYSLQYTKEGLDLMGLGHIKEEPD